MKSIAEGLAMLPTYFLNLLCISFPWGKEHKYRGGYKTQKFHTEKLNYKSAIDYF